jgi:hypothetical protein
VDPQRARRRALERARQSFGGFCVTHYLSARPEGLREAFITGGLPAFEVPVDDVYATTFALAIDRSRATTTRYPEDRARCARLQEARMRLPSADELTPSASASWAFRSA